MAAELRARRLRLFARRQIHDAFSIAFRHTGAPLFALEQRGIADAALERARHPARIARDA
jgi:hypothetical protein